MFKPASVQEIKRELESRSEKEIISYCMTLAKFKKDNKELLSFLLFESDNINIFSAKVTSEVDFYFNELSREKNLYFTKKSLRKILRIVNKYSKYAGDPKLTSAWLIYFCRKLKDSRIPFQKSPVLVNMYQNQLKKIRKLVGAMHEDLQVDYLSEIEYLEL